MDMRVVMPSKRILRMDVERRTPMLDLLVQGRSGRTRAQCMLFSLIIDKYVHPGPYVGFVRRN